MQVVDPFTHQEMIVSLEKELRATAETKLQEFKEKVLNDFHLKSCELYLEMGLAVDEIIEFTRVHQIDLIVMGTGGASGLSEVFLGSNTAKVIENATCPVISIPLTYDFSKHPNAPELHYAMDITDIDIVSLLQLHHFTKLLETPLTFVHILKEPDIERKELISEATQFLSVRFQNLSFQIHYALDTLTGLKEYTDQNPNILFAMTTHKRGFLEKLVTKSFTTSVAYLANLPLLALHKLDH